MFGENDLLESVVVSSGRKRYECIYFVPVNSLIGLFRTVGRDYPTAYNAVWDEERSDYHIRGLPPARVKEKQHNSRQEQ